MFKSIIDVLTFKPYRDRREALKRRKRYEELKSLIVDRHNLGHNGLVVTNPKFDMVDLRSFKPPMYYLAQNADRKYCIFWDKKKMTEEVGEPANAAGRNDDKA